MLQRCEDTNLCLNWEKSHFMVKEGIVLGHKISKKGFEVDKAKINVIANLPHPTTIKGLALRETDATKKSQKSIIEANNMKTSMLQAHYLLGLYLLTGFPKAFMPFFVHSELIKGGVQTLFMKTFEASKILECYYLNEMDRSVLLEYDKYKDRMFYNCHKMGTFCREVEFKKHKRQQKLGIQGNSIKGRVRMERCLLEKANNIKGRENNDDSFIEDWVSDDEEEVGLPKGHRNRGIKEVGNGQKTDQLGFLMKTGLKTIKNAKSLSTDRSVNTARPVSTASFDMKNIVPKDGLTCLVAKATSEESMLWHRRLGHVNFKNINKLVKDNLVREGLESISPFQQEPRVYFRADWKVASYFEMTHSKSFILPVSTGLKTSLLFKQERMSKIFFSDELGFLNAIYEGRLTKFKLQNVWVLVDLPKGHRAIGTKWVYRNKKDERGIVMRNKLQILLLRPYLRRRLTMMMCLLQWMNRSHIDDFWLMLITWVSLYTIWMSNCGFPIWSNLTVVVYVCQPQDVKSCLFPQIWKRPWSKDERLMEVDGNLFRSDDGSLMYLYQHLDQIYVCRFVHVARFQLPKNFPISLAVSKRIFRYLKGNHLRFFVYSKGFPMGVSCYLISDYAGAKFDRKSTWRLSILGNRLILGIAITNCGLQPSTMKLNMWRLQLLWTSSLDPKPIALIMDIPEMTSPEQTASSALASPEQTGMVKELSNSFTVGVYSKLS
ncbi:reverse transcriptase domain-containing protein [Tanacetum coccineum]|uniref:Reverse transcriptase domain-containing protein n=1 Tax=Tanacetum coccineum TaxID=301880 RepID=A0ABQ5BYG1_9ASTR